MSKRCINRIVYLFMITLCGYLAECNTVADVAYFAEIKADRFTDLIGLKVAVSSPRMIP